FAMITRQKDAMLFFAEAYGGSSEFIDYVRAMPVERGRGTATGRALLEGRVIHIADVLANPDYTWAEGQRLGGYRTVLGVPMFREGLPTGVLTLTRSEVRPFTEKQIELLPRKSVPVGLGGNPPQAVIRKHSLDLPNGRGRRPRYGSVVSSLHCMND